ncbi:MAG: type II toxin-antitoxin system VapC family toxin, partial [Aureliella sp.]
MKLLLDTHVVLWWLDDPRLINDEARNAIEDPVNDIFVSAVVAWEVAIKSNLGKLTIPPEFEKAIHDAGFVELPISLKHAWRVARLAGHHQDPFDRMLVAQAIEESATIVSRDFKIPLYGIP